MAIQLTQDINESQIHPPPRFPNVLHRSMWNWPLTEKACLICHNGCMGSCLYALLTSDLNKRILRLGYFFRTANSLLQRSCMVSSLTLTLDFWIVEFRECGPLLWSKINLYFPGVLFGTALIGEECIPGSSFLPKGFDQRPLFISSRDCCLMNFAFSLLVTGERWPEPSYVVGKRGSLVSAHGQNPFLSPRITDLTKRWLGWVLRYFLKTLILIGETTLKRPGFWEMVLRAALFRSSFLGGDGTGAAVRVE